MKNIYQNIQARTPFKLAIQLTGHIRINKGILQDNNTQAKISMILYELMLKMIFMYQYQNAFEGLNSTTNL